MNLWPHRHNSVCVCVMPRLRSWQILSTLAEANIMSPENNYDGRVELRALSRFN